MQLSSLIEKQAEDLGTDFFGIADLSTAHQFILEQGGPVIAEYPKAISVGITLLDSIVDQLPKRAEKAIAIEYRHYGYDVVNNKLDFIALHLSNLLQRQGYRAFPIPASKRVDDERICAAFSHKLAAHLAGLGWIGKSCLLITPQAGPRVRWATVLTDAPLEPTGYPLEERCGECLECVEICPIGAFTDRSFNKDETREKRYDARKCESYHKDLEKTMGVGLCGMCLYVCPYGRTKGKK
jgi:epoxyqueuosine reductase